MNHFIMRYRIYCQGEGAGRRWYLVCPRCPGCVMQMHTWAEVAALGQIHHMIHG